MLRPLTSGKEKSSCVLIQDTKDQPGIGLVKCFLAHLLSSVDKVKLVLYGHSSAVFCRGLPADIIQRLEVHDASSDPLGWEELSELKLSTDLPSYLFKVGASHQGRVAIVIDSLSHLLFHQSVTSVCRLLHRLTHESHSGAEVISLVAGLHGDLHDDLTLNLLHHSASSVIKMETSQSNQYHALANTLHKKLSGKVVKVREHFNLTNDMHLDVVDEFKPLTARAESETGPDPTANLTFNLTLKETEKEARSQLQLPYLHDQQKKEATLEKSVGAGKIFYQPDEVDDFDEDDPDDDLDI